MERRIPQAKIFKGVIAPPASLKSLTRIALLATRAEAETVIVRPPQGRGVEALAKFLSSNFKNLTLEEERWRLRGLNGDGVLLPGAVDVGSSGEFLEILCALFFGPGLLIEGAKEAVTPRFRRILKTLSASGFSFDLLEEQERFRLTLLQSAPDVIACTLDGGDEFVKTACFLAMALTAAPKSRLIESVPVPSEVEAIAVKMGPRVGILDREGDEEPADGAEISELEKRIRKLQSKRREPGEPSARILTLEEGGHLTGSTFELFSDPLLAAPFILAAVLHPNGTLKVNGLSPEASFPFISFLTRAGANIETNRRKAGVTVECRGAGKRLSPREIRGRYSAALGELLPFVFVAAAYAEGETIVRDAAFLREGPVDLIDASAKNLRALGVKIGELPDGLVIEGAKEHDGVELDSFGSPVIAMAFSAAALRNQGESVVKGAEAVDLLWPDFFFKLEAFTREGGA